MNETDIKKIAKSCKDIAISLDSHPYWTADSIAGGLLSYPDSPWLAYRIKMEIHKNTEEKTVPWKLPEPIKPIVLID